MCGSINIRMDHRKPPKPEHYDTLEKGICRFCGGDILKASGQINFRASWHKECVEEYKIIYWPKETRKAVWDRDRGHCAGCGVICGKKGWEMDHIIPLIEAQGNIEMWKLPNLATLCWECHKKKTGSEASRRAEARAIQKAHMKKTGSRPKKGRTKPRL